jgi:hypothetical protein
MQSNRAARKDTISFAFGWGRPEARRVHIGSTRPVLLPALKEGTRK